MPIQTTSTTTGLEPDSSFNYSYTASETGVTLEVDFSYLEVNGIVTIVLLSKEEDVLLMYSLACRKHGGFLPYRIEVEVKKSISKAEIPKEILIKHFEKVANHASTLLPLDSVYLAHPANYGRNLKPIHRSVCEHFDKAIEELQNI